MYDFLITKCYPDRRPARLPVAGEAGGAQCTYDMYCDGSSPWRLVLAALAGAARLRSTESYSCWYI